MDKVVVLMSTYNGERYLEEQLESLLSQQGVELSILVRDDGSTDSTLEILDKYAQAGKLKWYTGENLRTARSFMDLVHTAESAGYYAFCDQDDVWKPDKLLRAVTKIKEKEDRNIPVLYCSDYQLVDAELNTLPETHHKSTTTFNAAIVSCCATGCTVVFNNNLRAFLNSYSPEYQAMHDSWACRVCLAVGGSVIFDEEYKALYYRQHGNNVLGDNRTLKTKAKLFFDRIRTKECAISRQAKELLNGYSESMSADNIAIAKTVADYRESFLKRLGLFFSTKIKTPYPRLNIGIKVSILLGYL